MAVIENQPKEEVIVSIIIPVKNEEKYISKCIKSVLRQNFDKKNMELILIDGNSKDETVKIIRNFMNWDLRMDMLQNMINILKKNILNQNW